MPVTAPGVTNVRFVRKGKAGNVVSTFESCNGSFPLGCWIQKQLCGNGFVYLEQRFLANFQQDVEANGGTGEIFFQYGGRHKKYDHRGKFLESTVPTLAISRTAQGIKICVKNATGGGFIIESSPDLSKGWALIHPAYAPSSAASLDREFVDGNLVTSQFYRIQFEKPTP